VAKRRAFRSTSRGPKDQVWATVILVNQVVDDDPTIQFNLVQPTDWTAVGSAERATVLRVRGWLAFSPPLGVPSTMFSIISLMDEDIGVGGSSPVDAATYGDEDILWTYGQSVAVTAAATDIVIPTINVDIKSMRKITSGMDLRISLESAGPAAAGWTINGVLRSLVRRGGN